MNLHPGALAAILRLDADELTLARLMAAGDLISPQRYHNVTLINIRITGTGVSYRPALDEYVFRKTENYLTPEFLARCNGLPVIMHHPEKSLLTSDEFLDRIVGTVMLPYIKGDEVWAIAKIYDADTIKLLETKQMSTSPAVLLDKSTKLKLEDGTKLLVEGKPSLLDHIAICENGVWDKGGDPSGVEQTSIEANIKGDSVMAEDNMNEEDKKADAARADAERRLDEKLDLCLKGIDSVKEMMDATNKRMDAFEVGETKKDSEDEEETKKDSEDEEETKKDSEDEEPENTKARRLAADKARKDTEEEKEAKRMDSVNALKKTIDAQAEMLKRLETLVRQPISDDFRPELTKAQARADEVLQQHGKRAPAPMAGETPAAYRRRMASALQAYSDKWSKIKLDSLPDDAFENIENDVYADAIQRAKVPTDIAVGKMREITRRSDSGHTITEFVGNDTHFVKGFSRKPRRVRSFYTARG